MKRIFCLISALLLSFPLLLQAGPFMSSGGGVALQDSDGSSGGYATTLKLSTGDWSVTGGVATVTVFGDAITVADTNDTTAYVGFLTTPFWTLIRSRPRIAGVSL